MAAQIPGRYVPRKGPAAVQPQVQRFDQIFDRLKLNWMSEIVKWQGDRNATCGRLKARTHQRNLQIQWNHISKNFCQTEFNSSTPKTVNYSTNWGCRPSNNRVPAQFHSFSCFDVLLAFLSIIKWHKMLMKQLYLLWLTVKSVARMIKATQAMLDRSKWVWLLLDYFCERDSVITHTHTHLICFFFKGAVSLHLF